MIIFFALACASTVQARGFLSDEERNNLRIRETQARLEARIAGVIRKTDDFLVKTPTDELVVHGLVYIAGTDLIYTTYQAIWRGITNQEPPKAFLFACALATAHACDRHVLKSYRKLALF